ncbi:MAG: DUF523 domain-containing protein [Deltaproteobacteria bacterium]|nr:MAG: DUF523 domain-containing protein [Deltaproteobacteria bacterium]
MLHAGDSILVSACLLGVACRYDGGSKPNAKVIDLIRRHNLRAVPVCPEQLAGLPTPRPACRFKSGDGTSVLAGHHTLVDRNGQDVSEAFVRGARETLRIARLCGCRTALLKERSPSCGPGSVWVDNHLVAGMGVTAALLTREGLELFSEEALPEVDRA